jgi:hypothetical protein
VRGLAATIVAATLALSAAVASTATASARSQVGLSASPFVRSCGTDVWGDLGPVRRWQRQSIVVGPFAFAWIRQARRTTAASIHRAYRAGQGAFKILAVVQRGYEVTVTVPAGERRHVALLYDPSAFDRAQTVNHGEQAVVFRACPPSTDARPQDWSAATQFNGGIIVDSPRCVRLTIRVSKDGPARMIAAPFGPVSC